MSRNGGGGCRQLSNVGRFGCRRLESHVVGKMDTAHLMPSARRLPLLDAALAVWVAAWIALGIAIGVSVHNLTGLSHTVVVEGQAVETVGHSLKPLGGVPLVGGSIGGTAEQVQQAGASAVESGRTSASSIRDLSVLLAIAVALLPSVPVFGFYLPLRIQRAREARALRRDVQLHGSDPRFHAFLARRAASSLGYTRVKELDALHWSEGEHRHSLALAAAELRRLGIDTRLLSGPSTRSPRPATRARA
jgi:hypothetical protein